MNFPDTLGVVVLVPCYSKETAIPLVIRDFQAALPDTPIYVYDNNSSDRTAEVARAAGAIVRTETMQGKGHIIRRMLADIEADFNILVDGDATYEAAAAPRLVERAYQDGLDMVNGARITGREWPTAGGMFWATGC